MYNLFLTGKRGVGKTTLLKKTIDNIDASFGGFMVVPDNKPTCKSFIIHSLYDGKIKTKIGDAYTKNNEVLINTYNDSFDTEVVNILNQSIENRDVIVMDELGFLEKSAYKFQNCIKDILDSNKVVLGVLKKCHCDFIDSIKDRSDILLYEITEENRDSIIDDIMEKLTEFPVAFKDNDKFHWNHRMISWYDAALSSPLCEYSSALLKEMQSKVCNISKKTILDIGAGTGAFSLPLAQNGAIVTALDSSIYMLEALISKSHNKGLDITCILSSFERAKLNKYDIVVSGYSAGSLNNKPALAKLYESIKSFAFIVGPINYEHDNFDVKKLFKTINKTQRRFPMICKDTLLLLDDLNIPYEFKEIAYNFPQYFKTFSDAEEFFQVHFSIEPCNIASLKNFLHDHLQKYNDGYIFPNIRKSGVIIIKKF